MGQPRPSPTPSVASPAPTATEVVTRPEPGLARGAWEAPAWVLWLLAAAVVLVATGYVLRRLGVAPGLTRGEPSPSRRKPPRP